MRLAGNAARIGGEEERVWVIGGKARKKEATRKTETGLVWLRIETCEELL
jgi:hypothetical protein